MTVEAEVLGADPAEQHVLVLATLYVVWGALALILAGSMGLLGVAAAILSTSDELDPQSLASAAVTAAFFFLAAAIALGWGIAHLLDGLALRRRNPWARLVGLVLAAVNLFSFPFGTALGIYALWVMLNDQTRAVFGRAPRRLA